MSRNAEVAGGAKGGTSGSASLCCEKLRGQSAIAEPTDGTSDRQMLHLGQIQDVGRDLIFLELECPACQVLKRCRHQYSKLQSAPTVHTVPPIGKVSDPSTG